MLNILGEGKAYFELVFFVPGDSVDKGMMNLEISEDKDASNEHVRITLFPVVYHCPVHASTKSRAGKHGISVNWMSSRTASAQAELVCKAIVVTY